MARSKVVLANTIFSYKEETTEGTAIADAAANLVLLRKDPLAWNFGREQLDDDFMSGTLSHRASVPGMYSDDLGFSCSMWMRGTGVQNAAPDYAAMLKHLFGAVSIGVNGTVLASPTPSTTGFTVSGATIIAGHLARVEVTASNFEYTRILTESSLALTVWPALSAAPGTNAIQSGYAFLLKSGLSDFLTGTANFYFDGSKKLVFAGCRGAAATITLETGKKVGLEMTFQALSVTPSYTAIGYTPVAADWNRTAAPICLGIESSILYKGTVVTGSTTTSVILSGGDGPDLEIEVGDILIVNVGSDVYETKTITAVSGTSDKTLTVSALSSAPSADDFGYIKHVECIPSLSISVENTINKDLCMYASDGFGGASVADRSVNMTMDGKKWRDLFALQCLENVVSVEIWAVVGSTAGNLLAFCIPAFSLSEVSLGSDNGMMTQAESGQATLASTGDDEVFLTHL